MAVQLLNFQCTGRSSLVGKVDTCYFVSPRASCSSCGRNGYNRPTRQRNVVHLPPCPGSWGRDSWFQPDRLLYIPWPHGDWVPLLECEHLGLFFLFLLIQYCSHIVIHDARHIECMYRQLLLKFQCVIFDELQ